MAGIIFPSGDAAADRRASYAEMLVQEGDLPAAIEVLSGALELAPDWAAGWFRLGELSERSGDIAQAAESWGRAIEADPEDRFGAGLKRDLIRQVPVVETMPPAFVELLFDQYAPKFEGSLVGKLGYRGPGILLDELDASGFIRAARALDLGCGTGLMGELLRSRCDWLAGFDISGGMLSRARAKRLYDQLDQKNIALLALSDDRFDLIIAADVFIYLGALEHIIGWCAGSLAPDGLLAFTIELGEKPLELRKSRRFAHSKEYVDTLLKQAGFRSVRFSECSLRQDQGQDLAFLSVVASLQAVRHNFEGDGELEVFV